VDPQQPSTIYFLGFNSAVGFFRSNDAGKTWTGISLIGAVAAPGDAFLEVDPVFTNIIYLGAGGVLRKSTDFGTTWSVVTLPNLPAQNGGSPIRVDGLSVDPSAAGTLYVSYEVFMYKSADFGNTWTILARIPGPLASFSIGTVIVDPRNSNTLYVADQYPFLSGSCNNTECGLFRSADGGNSWTNVAPAGVYTEVTFDSRNGNLYVGGSIVGLGGGVLKSTDGGNTWNPVNNKVSRNQLVTDPGAAGTLLAFDPYGAQPEVFQSSDAGATWTQINLKAVAIGSSFQFPNVYCIAAAKPVGNVSAASFLGGAVTPESIVSALGFDLATGAVQATQQGITTLGGTTVTVVDSTGTSRLAPLFYVSQPGELRDSRGNRSRSSHRHSEKRRRGPFDRSSGNRRGCAGHIYIEPNGTCRGLCVSYLRREPDLRKRLSGGLHEFRSAAAHRLGTVGRPGLPSPLWHRSARGEQRIRNDRRCGSAGHFLGGTRAVCRRRSGQRRTHSAKPRRQRQRRRRSDGRRTCSEFSQRDDQIEDQSSGLIPLK
jgi:photosystem II stability/assembly factor-like uncharacterized protein